MALRSLDNALPADLVRPKKMAKVVPSCNPDPVANNENGELPATKAEDVSPEYVLSEDLKALEDPEAKIEVLMKELESKDWIKVCEALNDGRRLAIHHHTLMLPILKDVLLVMVKAMKNPRSALIKTSIMASTDIFRAYGLVLLSTSEHAAAFDQLLLQLLLKASQDKKFVCEEAERALEAMAVSMSPIPLLNKLKAYGGHTNMRVRAKAAVAISKCTSKMETVTMKEFGLAKLLQVGAKLLSDRLPEARESARSIINSIYAAFALENVKKEKGEEGEGDEIADEEKSTNELWLEFCSANLPPLSAQSVAKIFVQ